MKKGQIAEGVVTEVEFPNCGIVMTDEKERVIVKNVIPGQRVSFSVSKARRGKTEARLLETLVRSPLETESPCPHFGECGGCTYQTLPYEEQLRLKEAQVQKLIRRAVGDVCPFRFEGIKASPRKTAYRNKMEFSFGDAYMDGPLALGMHRRGSFYDIVTVENCQIVDEDFRAILRATLDFFAGKNVPFFHRMHHIGYLRHLLVRKAVKTGQILVDLVTTTQEWDKGAEGESCAGKTCAASDVNAAGEACAASDVCAAEETCVSSGVRAVGETCAEREFLSGWVSVLRALPLRGVLQGILHTKNDSVADVIKDEGTSVLWGGDFFYEELLGLRFRISPFSFFQTNSLGAEVLYETARDFILGDSPELLRGKTVYDLYSGTGTIAQILAPVCRSVVGVEIVEEAVEAARENAAENGLSNCRFLAGDVLKLLDTIDERPDFIVLDPPREGVHPKALEKIIAYGVDKLLYISCKPTSLARDLEVFLARGYAVERICCVDMFPGTVHVETVVMLSKGEIYSKKVRVEFSLEDMDMSGFRKSATYEQIKAYVLEKSGLKVSSLYISQVKRKCGLEVGQNYNLAKNNDAKMPQCPLEKEKAIMEALKYFRLI